MDLETARDHQGISDTERSQLIIRNPCPSCPDRCDEDANVCGVCGNSYSKHYVHLLDEENGEKNSNGGLVAGAVVGSIVGTLALVGAALGILFEYWNERQ